MLIERFVVPDPVAECSAIGHTIGQPQSVEHPDRELDIGCQCHPVPISGQGPSHGFVRRDRG